MRDWNVPQVPAESLPHLGHPLCSPAGSGAPQSYSGALAQLLDPLSRGSEASAHTQRGNRGSGLRETASWDVTGTSPAWGLPLCQGWTGRTNTVGMWRGWSSGCRQWGHGRGAVEQCHGWGARGPLTHPPTAGSSFCLAHLGSRCSLLLVLAHMPPMASPACPAAVPACAVAHWVWSLPAPCPEAAPRPHTLCVCGCVPHTMCACWCFPQCRAGVGGDRAREPGEGRVALAVGGTGTAEELVPSCQ